MIQEFDNIRLIDQNTIFNYIPLRHPYRPSYPGILFVIRGSFLLKEQITTHKMVPNTIIFIDVNHVYEVIEVSDDVEIVLLGYERYFLDRISLKLNKVKVYQGLKRQLQRKFMIPEIQMDILLDHINKFKFYQNQEVPMSYLNEIIEHLFIIILFHVTSIVELNIKEHYAEMTRSQKMVNDFILLVSQNYLTEKSVLYYAQLLGITTRYMSSVIKKETGKTPQQFISEFVLNEAKAQLSSTKKDIKEIASELHFSDQYSFSHFFKKYQGESPSRYRKMFTI